MYFKVRTSHFTLKSVSQIINFSADHTEVEPIKIPDGCAPGDRISVDGYSGMPDEQLNPKKKVWEKLQVDLKTNESGEATWQGNHLITPTGGKIISRLINSMIK